MIHTRVKENMTLLCRKYCPRELQALSNSKLPVGMTGIVGISVDEERQEEEEKFNELMRP